MSQRIEYKDASGKLKCGCVPGMFLCEVACRLWEETGRAYRIEQQTGKMQPYHKAMLNYAKHVDPLMINHEWLV